jgi:ParB-like nuclease domain
MSAKDRDVSEARPAAVDPVRSAYRTESVPIDSIIAADSPRLNGESIDHTRLLAASGAGLPPILVHRETMRVIDGMHRLQAARLRGEKTVEVRFFEGTQDEAFIEAVRANTTHGLPLTLADREAAASRILASHPQHSDRRIARVTGLAAGTVGAIRQRDGSGGGSITARRIGRDGRVRPVNGIQGRIAAGMAIAQHPGASLREISRIAGISPTTVRDVRERMRRGQDPAESRPDRDQSRPAPATRRPTPDNPRGMTRPTVTRDRASLMLSLRKDPSLRLTESGRSLLRYLDAQAKGPKIPQDLLDALPPHSAYTLAALALVCADEWRDLAIHLEQRLRNMA